MREHEQYKNYKKIQFNLYMIKKFTIMRVAN